MKKISKENMENISKVNLTTNHNPKNDLVAVIMGFYLQTVMTYLGGFFNFICILIFIKIIKKEQQNQGHLFKYLLIKSICDCAFCVQNMPQMFYYRADFSISVNLGMQYWYKYFFYFAGTLLSQLSVWFELAASIDCVCLVARKFPWHKTKTCFWIVTVGLVVFYFIYYFPNIFLFTIQSNGKDCYYPKRTEFGLNLKIRFYRNLFHTILRDILPLIISLVLNSIIVYYIHQLTVNRRKMTTKELTSASTSANALVRRSQKAERNKIKMMFFTSFIHLFRLPILLYNFNIFNIRSSNFLVQLCLLSLSVSYIVPFMFYIGFNNTLKKYFLNIFLCLSKCRPVNERSTVVTI
jgi:hypothetical protein